MDFFSAKEEKSEGFTIQSNDSLKQYSKSFPKVLIMLKTVNLLVSGMDLFLSHPTPT